MWIEELMDQGVTTNTIEQIIRTTYERSHYEREKRYWHDYSIRGPTTHTSISELAHFPSLYDLEISLPGKSLIPGAILSKFKADEPFYKKYFSSIPARWISCDHTFKSVANIGYIRQSDRKWVKLYQNLFCVLNERGSVVQWKFTTTEGFSEVENVFRTLAKRFESAQNKLEGIFLDNCCKWANLLSTIFPNVPVKLELFHAVQRMLKTIPKHSTMYAQIAKDYPMVFRDPLDIGLERRLPTPTKEVLVANLEKFKNKWTHVKYLNGNSVLTKGSHSQLNNIMFHIEKGCLSGIDPGCGTNRNERLHKHLNKLITANRIRLPLLVYAKMFKVLYKLEICVRSNPSPKGTT